MVMRVATHCPIHPRCGDGDESGSEELMGCDVAAIPSLDEPTRYAYGQFLTATGIHGLSGVRCQLICGGRCGFRDMVGSCPWRGSADTSSLDLCH
ncbi:hypothetical protein GCM10010464_86290 [Pseudonocardia yunnanensis]